MSAIRAVVFDMDGVLVDSEPLYLRATQLALGPRGPSYTARDNRAFLETPDAELFRVLRILFDVATPTEELVERRRDHLVALIRAEARPLPGVPEMPLRLREAGLEVGVVSAAGRRVLEALLDALGLRRVFRAVVSADEVARGKPAPDALLMGARRLEVSPEHCLVVDDARDGVLAAKAAGMPVAAVPSPATSHEDFSPADFVLPSLEALPKALESGAHDAGGRM
jgi:HAD superfamily hydrolase (TIGR01509 family)